jgi:hypothetical protein
LEDTVGDNGIHDFAVLLNELDGGKLRDEAGKHLTEIERVDLESESTEVREEFVRFVEVVHEAKAAVRRGDYP